MISYNRWQVRYGLAVAIALLALALRLVLVPIIGPGTLYIVAFPAIMIVAVTFGLGPGLLGTVLSIVLIEVSFAESAGHVDLSASLALRASILLITALYVGRVGDRLRAACMRADAQAAAAGLAEAAARESAERLSASEERFRGVMDNMLEGCQILGRDWRYIYINDAAERHNRRQKGELIGQRYMDMWPGIETTSLFAAIRRCMEERTPQAFENEFAFPDGTVGWFDLSLQPVPEGVFILSVDVTERKRAENERQTALSRFYSVLSNMYAGVLLVTNDNRIEFVNQAFCDYFGVTASPSDVGKLNSMEVVEKIKRAYLHPSKEVARIEEIVGQGKPVRGEEIALQNGRTCLRDFIPILLDGKPYGRLWHHLDITGRKQVEDELRENREWLHVTLSSIGDAVVAGDEGARITFLNPVAAALTGWSQEEAIGQPLPTVFNIINEQTREPVEPPCMKALNERRIVTLANHSALIAKDGREIPIEDSAAPILDAGGNVAGVVLVFHDVTEKRRAVDALRKAHDELETRVQERTVELQRTMALIQAERKRFRDALDQLPAYLVLLSPDYHVPFANRFFEERFGQSNGRRCYEYLFGRTEPCENCETYKVMKTNAPHRWQWTGPDARDYDIYDFPFTDVDGTKLIMEVGLDITERNATAAELEKHRHHLEDLVLERTAQLETTNAQFQTEIVERKHAEEALRASRLAALNLMEDAVAARRQAEQASAALRESQADLNRAQAVGNIGNWHMDVRRNKLTWSDENYRIFGVPKDTPLTYESFLDAVHPEDQARVNEKWLAALRGEPYDIEHRVAGGDTVKWVREKAELEFDAQHNMVGAFGTTQDVTKRKQAEEALRRSRDRSELLAATMGALLQSGEPQRVVETLCTRVMEHLDCHVFFNFLVDEQAERLHLNAYAGIPEEEAAKIEWLDYGVAVCGCAAVEGCRIVAEHIPTTPDPRTDLVRSYGVQAYACHPLLGPNSRIFGTLSFGSRNRETFSEDDLALMKSVADHVAVAMDRVNTSRSLQRAHDELERRVEERTADLDAANAALRREMIERERNQRALLEQSRVVESFFAHTVTPLVFLDRKLRFIRVNEAYAKSCQRDASELQGQAHFELYPSEELESHFHEVLRTKVPYLISSRPFEFPDHLEWGTSYWDLAVSPVLDDFGEVDFLVFSLNDVTKRALAEQHDRVVALVHSLFTAKSSRKDYLISLVHVLRDWSGCENAGIRVVDHDARAPYGAHVGFNKVFLECEGVLHLEGDDDCICTRVLKGETLASDASMTTEQGSFHCNDSHAWVKSLSPETLERYRGNCMKNGYRSLLIMPIRYQGKTIGLLHLADSRVGLFSPVRVTFAETLMPLIGEALHRFDVEEALRAASQYARGLLEASLDPLVTISHEGEITDVNRATELATGLSRQELIGSDFSDYFTEPDRAREGYERVLAEGQLTDHRLTMRHASGRTISVLYNATVYHDDAGEILGVFAAVRDITKLVQAQEEARLRQEQLLQADKMVSLGILVSGVAHEINNPNYFIRSNADVLKDAWRGAMPILDEYYEDSGDFVLGGLNYTELRERVPLLCQDIVDGSARIQAIVSELRDYARSNPGAIKENVNLADTVHSATTLLSNMLAKSTSRYSFHCDEDLPKIWGNYQRLEQVVINLLQNACQALSDKSKGIFVSVVTEREKQQVVLTVRDEGGGIPEEALKHLMDPFFTTKRNIGGTGLGLSIAASIVREHGGTLEFESRVGEGTTARMCLPIRGEESVQTMARTAE